MGAFANIGEAIPAILLIDKVGRKKVIIAGALGMGVCQIIVASIYAAYEDSWDTHREAGWATAVFIWAYISCFGKSALPRAATLRR